MKQDRFKWSRLLIFFPLIVANGRADAQPLFGPQQLISRTSDLSEVRTFELADLDGDADLDVIVTSEWDAVTVWYEYDMPRRDFIGPHVIDTAQFALGIYPVDLDLDGDVDIVSATMSSVGWYENLDGAGTFGSMNVISAEWARDFGSTVVVVDADSDGDYDVFIPGRPPHEGDFGLCWFENVGEATWAESPHVVTETTEIPILAADLDGDGDDDLLTDTGWRPNLDGQGDFGQKFPLPSGPGPYYSADLDGDGDLDLLHVMPAFWGASLQWLENIDGLGTFGEAEGIETFGLVGVAPADVDNDGDADILVSTGKQMQLWLSDRGSFKEARVEASVPDWTPNCYGATVRSADVDGDGDPEFLANFPCMQAVTLLDNTSRGTFGDPQFVMAPSETEQAWDVDAADIDLDGDEDVVVVSRADSRLSWYENRDGRGSFGSQNVIASELVDPITVIATDVTGDSAPDILVGTVGDGVLSLYRNRGDGTFSERKVVTEAANWICHLRTVDLDTDGDLDVLAAKSGAILSITNADGAGTFNDPVEILGPGCIEWGIEPKTFAPADLDGDADPDVITSLGPHQLAWYANNGIGEFGAAQVITDAWEDVGNYIRYFATADVDGDGDLDAIWIGGDPYSLVVRRNDGNADFGPSEHFGVLGSPGLLADPYDLDQDDDVDLVVALGQSRDGYAGSGIGWMKNEDGNGSFSDPVAFTWESNGVRAARLADLDGDGDMDLLSASYMDDKVAWYENLSAAVAVDGFALPSRFELWSAYPNPFNPTTTISYALPQAADVTLTVFDVLGRAVKELAAGTKPAGNHEISFHATGLPSGVYFYRLQAGDYVETKRMVVVR